MLVKVSEVIVNKAGRSRVRWAVCCGSVSAASAVSVCKNRGFGAARAGQACAPRAMAPGGCHPERTSLR